MSDPLEPASADVPVALIHGWGGSFATTWVQNGFTELLADAGREVIGIDLLGHGTAPKPHDPAAYGDLTDRVLEALPDRPADAVGFSLGAITLLRTAVAHPERFNRLVLAGVGTNVFARDGMSTDHIIAALEGTGDVTDITARLFAQYANQPGNDVAALAAVMKRVPDYQLTPADLARITCPVLVIVGDQDFVHPADDLVAALPDARSVVLRNVDHFATTDAFGFIDATLEFLDAIPS